MLLLLLLLLFTGNNGKFVQVVHWQVPLELLKFKLSRCSQLTRISIRKQSKIRDLYGCSLDYEVNIGYREQ